MNVNYYNLSQISADFKIGLKDYSSLFKGGMSLNNYLMNNSYVRDIKSGRTPSRFTPEYWNGDYEFITMQDVDTRTYTLNKTVEDKITDEAIINEKTLLKVPENSLIISNAMTIGLAFIVDRPVYINQNVFWLNVDTEKINKKFLLWYFNCYIREIFQKTYCAKYLSKQELSRINIPIISIAKQNDFEKSIASIEEKINIIKDSLKPYELIISEVFENYFKYDYKKFNELKNIKTYSNSFGNLGNNTDIRFSVKFHRPAGEFVYQELKNRPYKKLKEYIEIPMITGQGITPSDFDDDGDYSYISMAEINTWELKTDELKNVSNQYASENKAKKVKGIPVPISTELEVNDIVMMRSGEGGIGKVAIIKEKITAIFCDFLIRIKVNERLINPEFAYYFFRTYYFQYLVEINKKGLGNNTNIFPNIIQEFPIPDIQIDEQKQIVDKINEEIKEQKKIEEKILKERNKIEQTLAGVLRAPN